MAADGPDVAGQTAEDERPVEAEATPPFDLAPILAALVERIPAAVFAKDETGRYLLVNAAVEQQFGRPRQEILGRTDHDLLAPAVAAAFQANDRRALERGEPIETTTTGALPDGLVTYRSVKFPLLDEHGVVSGVGGVSIDVSDRRWTDALVLAEIGSHLGVELDPDQLIAAVTSIIATHFGLSRCFFAELDPAGQLIVRHDHDRGGGAEGPRGGEDIAAPPPVPFEPWVMGALVAGQTIVIGASGGLAGGEEDGEPCLAYVAVPLLRDGRTAALLAACAPPPRVWSGGEVALLETVAHRAWLAMENARLFRETAAALRERDATLAALAESEARFRQLTENIDNAVFWITDLPSRRVTYVSPSYQRLWGLSADRLLTGEASWMDAVHLDDRAHVDRAFIEDAPRGGFDVEYRLVLPDGRVRWIHDRGYPLASSPDGQIRITGVAEDVTARREREERAVRLQALTAALAGAADPTAVADAILEHALPAIGADAGSVTLVREAAEPDKPTFVVLARRGDHPSRLTPGKSIPAGEPSALADAVVQRMPIVFRSHAERLARYPHLRDQGAIRTGAGIALPLIVEGRPVGAIGLSFPGDRDFPGEELDFFGTLAGLAAQALDRARLLEAEQAARAAAEDARTRYRSLFDGAADAILVADLDGRLQDVNPALLQLLGYEREELLRLRIADLVAGDLERIGAAYARFLRDGTWQGEHLVRQKDGSLVPVESNARIAATPAGPVQWMALRDITARRAAEDALSDANERFTLATQAVQGVIYDWDLVTGQVHRSAGLRRLIGFGPEEATGRPDWWIARIHPEDPEPLEIWASLDDQPIDRFSVEYRVRHRDGHDVPVWDQGLVVRDAAGQAVRIVGSRQDLTPLRQAEERLRLLGEAGARLAGALDVDETMAAIAQLVVPDLADIAIVYRVEDGVLRPRASAVADSAKAPLLVELEALNSLMVDDESSLVARVGRTGEPLLIERIDQAVAAGSAAPTARLGEIVAALAPRSAIVVPLDAGGGTIGAVVLATAESGRVFGQDDLVLAQELTRRAAVALDSARLYQQAQDAEARYRGLFEALPDGVLVAGPDGRYQEVNRAAADLLGYSRDELLRMSQADLSLTPAWAAEQDAGFRETGQWRGEAELRRRDGSALPAEVWVRQVNLASGPVSIATMRDVSARKALERLQQDFLGSVSHDLKNPLSVIKGQAQYLRRQLRRGDPPDPERLVRGLATIEETVERTTDLIQELMDVARLHGGHALELQRQLVDLVAVARGAAETYGKLSDRHAIRVESDEPTLAGLFDARRLERVIGNLLTNAIKYSPAGGEITIRLTRERDAAGEWALVAVQDRGVGIPEDDLAHVFERYRRGTNVRGIAGSGIGLAGVRQIVEQHGGTIGVESRQGAGSTFTARLPLGLPSGRVEGPTAAD